MPCEQELLLIKRLKSNTLHVYSFIMITVISTKIDCDIVIIYIPLSIGHYR
jgi:hypothetical protein